MIGFCFALDHEAVGLIAGLKKADPQADSFRVGELPCHTGILGGERIVIALIGMGAATAARRTALLCTHFSLRLLILTGYAGALIPTLRRNQLLIATNYLDPESESWLKRLPQGMAQHVSLYSAAEVVTTSAGRAALGAQGFAIVDMETAAVAEVTRLHRIPLLPLRIVSDEAGDRLPSAALNASFDLTAQRPRPLRLLAHLITHPQDIAPFCRFVGHLRPARQALNRTLERILPS